MISPSQCPKCGGNNTTLLFNGYICNVCEPIKVAKFEPKLFEPVKFYYGWICSRNYGYDERDCLLGLWGTAYASHAEARRAQQLNGTQYILRVKTNVPIYDQDRFTIQDHVFIERRKDGSIPQPKEHGYESKGVKGFATIVPETEGT